MQAEIIKLVSMSPELLKKETILVRCKDCKHFDYCYTRPIDKDDWFCADGERK